MKPYALHFCLPPPEELRRFLQCSPEFRQEDPFSGWLVFGGETSGEIPWDAAVAIGETESWLYAEVWTERGERFFRNFLDQLRQTYGVVEIEELNEDNYV